VERKSLAVEAEWMGYTDGSCCEDKLGHGALPARAVKGEIKERRGGPLEEKGVRAVVSPKEERKEREGEMRGVRYGKRRCEVESRPDVRKRKSAQCTRTASAAQCCGHARKGS